MSPYSKEIENALAEKAQIEAKLRERVPLTEHERVRIQEINESMEGWLRELLELRERLYEMWIYSNTVNAKLANQYPWLAETGGDDDTWADNVIRYIEELRAAANLTP